MADLPEINVTKVYPDVLCQITNIPAHNHRRSFPRKLIFLFDVSQSMGTSVRFIHKYFQSVVRQFNVLNVEVVTFGQYANRISAHGDIQNIMNWQCPELEGSTKMYEASKIVLENILTSREPAIYQILIISDGDVHDLNLRTRYGRHLDNVLDYVSKVDHNQYKHTIQVAGMRIGISGDTQALSCFFKFHNSTQPQILKDVAYSNEDYQIALLEIFESFQQGANVNVNQVSLSGRHELSFDPMSVNPTPNLLVRDNGWFIVRRGNLNGLLINNCKPLIIERPIIPDDVAMPYLESLEQIVRNFKVLGDEKPLQHMEKFLSLLKPLIHIEQILPEPGIKGRIKTLVRRSTSLQKNILTRIQTLLNVTNVDKLNSQQQASFLRSLDSDQASGRRLARRHADAGVEDIKSDFIRTIRDMIKKFDSGRRDNIGKDQDASFYSMLTTHDIISESLEEFKKNPNSLDDLELTALLQCIGAVGVCFTARTGDFPDPWSFRVDRVWFGVYLAQPDLWAAMDAANRAGQSGLKPPGFSTKDVITGVDPLLRGESGITKLYLKSGLDRFHASIAMRKVVALVPYDTIALKAAVCFQMIQQVIEQPTELGIKETLNSVDTLKYLIRSNDEFYKSLFGTMLDNPTNPAYWTGDLNVTNVIKVVAWSLIGSPDFTSIGELVYNMFSTDLFYRIRGRFQTHDIKERAPVIHDLLDIDFKVRGTKPTPLGEPEPQNPEYYNKYDSGRVQSRVLEWIRFDNLSKIWTRFGEFLSCMAKYGSDIGKWLHHLKTQLFFAMFDQERVTADALASLSVVHQDGRIDLATRTMRNNGTPNVFISTMVRGIYFAEYNRELGIKCANEEARRIELTIEALLWSCDLQEYIRILNRQIPERDSAIYQRFVDALVVSDQVPLMYEKIWILIFGRTTDFDPKDDIVGFRSDPAKIIWNRGNICKALELKVFERILSNAGVLGVNEIREVYRRLGYLPHVYRESNIPNRHGHSNFNPYIPPEYKI